MFRIRTLLPVLALAAAAACAESATTPATAPEDARLHHGGTHTVTLSGSPTSPASGDTVTVTATPSPSGSYYYRWTVERCTFLDGEPEGRCTFPITVGGTDLTQRKFQVDEDTDWHITVQLRASSTSTTNLATDQLHIIGLNVQ